MKELRIDHDHDAIQIMTNVNKQLADFGLRFVDDGEVHDGWCIYTLVDLEEETDEEYHERTGEPRGAGADWAGRVRGDFQE